MNHYFKRELILALLFLIIGGISVGCSSTEVDEPEAIEPGTGLPMIEATPNDGDCDLEIARQDQPTLAAWASGADSNLIGTIKEVRFVDERAIFEYEDESYEFGQPEDCDEFYFDVVEITLGDVETLYGEDLGESVTFRIRRQQATTPIFPGGAIEEDGEVVFPYDSEHTFAEGLRIGVGVNRIDDDGGGHYITPMRLFEVYEDTIYLQDIEPDLLEYMKQEVRCPALPNWGLYLPDEYDGQSLSKLREDIDELDFDINLLAQENESVEYALDFGQTIREAPSPRRYVGFDPLCWNGESSGPNTDPSEPDQDDVVLDD